MPVFPEPEQTAVARRAGKETPPPLFFGNIKTNMFNCFICISHCLLNNFKWEVEGVWKEENQECKIEARVGLRQICVSLKT